MQVIDGSRSASEVDEFAQSAGWKASLSLDFRVRGDGKTVLRHEHLGPLRIQKALYPEGSACCHAVIVHPPGGIASGDQLQVAVQIDAGAHALITTPSAAKWYGAVQTMPACQTVDLRVSGCLEWLPAETIVFDQACVESSLHVCVEPNGSMMGWDLPVFGRHASDERFERGAFNQTVSVSLGEALIWTDRLRLQGADPLFASPVGFQGHHALATLWLVTPEHRPFQSDWLASLRQAVPAVAWTLLHERLLVGRALADPWQLRTDMEQAWSWLRPKVLGYPANRPRIWST